MGNKSPKNNRIKEVRSKSGRNIPETAQDRIYNSIVRIETNDSFGTGFFIKLNIKNTNVNCLLTCFHVINKKLVDSDGIITIFYGKKSSETSRTIILNKSLRFIRCFDSPIDATVIEIIETDNISKDKYLFPDLNYKNFNGFNNYLNNHFILAGYPDDIEFFKERHICSGEITSVLNNYEFEHTLHTEVGSSGSPICLINNQNVIGIHKDGDIEEKINYGTFIGYIIEELGHLNDIEFEYIEINPYTILNIKKEHENKVYSKSFKDDKNKFLACFILENKDNYSRQGNIFKIEKNHFYFTIMNDLDNLKIVLKQNKLLLLERDDCQRSLLFLSVLLNYYEIVEYLTTTNIDINGWDSGEKTPTDIAEGNIYDLLVARGGQKYENIFYNEAPVQSYIYHHALHGSYIEFIYEQLLKEDLVSDMEDIIDINNILVGKRIFKKLKNNGNKYDESDYLKIYHGTKYSSIEPIMKYGLKNLKNPRKGHVPLKLKKNGIDNWANAIFVSPSIFYASSFSECICLELDDIYHIIIEGKIKKNSFISYKSTIIDYKFKEGEPKNEIEYRIDNDENNNIIVTSLLFIARKFLLKAEKYDEANIFK